MSTSIATTPTQRIETKVFPAGLWDWSITPEAGGYRTTGSEQQVADPDDIRSEEPLLVYAGPRTADPTPHGHLHRKPTPADDALPRPAGYPLDRWADSNVRGVQWPLAVAPESRQKYTQADQHIDHANGPGPVMDISDGEPWPRLSIRICDALPQAFEFVEGGDPLSRNTYRRYRHTAAMLDHLARLRWIGEQQRRADLTFIECTCAVCGTTWAELPAYRSNVCRSCENAITLARQPGMAHLLRHSAEILDQLERSSSTS